MKVKSKVIYIGQPYWHDNEEIRIHRFMAGSVVAGRLMERGDIVFSPIAHSHPIASMLNQQQNHDFWLKQDFHWLKMCDKLVVLKLDGWRESYGLGKEIQFARDNNIEIVYFSREHIQELIKEVL